MPKPEPLSNPEGRNLYRDTYQRMQCDAEFRSIVEQLARAAEQFGFTPGELKQIAFAAALCVEQRRSLPLRTLTFKPEKR